MRRKTFKLGEDNVILPRGTRVILRNDLRGEDGFLHRASTSATVREVFHNSYVLETASGRHLQAERDQLRMARQDLLADLGTRQWDFDRLRETVMYEAVVLEPVALAQRRRNDDRPSLPDSGDLRHGLII